MSYDTLDAQADLQLDFELALHTADAEQMFKIADAIKHTGDDEWAEEARALAVKWSREDYCQHDDVAHD